MPNPERFIKLAAGALALGLVSAVGTTWWIAAAFPVRVGNMQVGMVVHVAPNGYEWTEWPPPGPPRWTCVVEAKTGEIGSEPFPVWVQLPEPIEQDWTITAFGWPWPCLAYAGPGYLPDPAKSDAWPVRLGGETHLLPLRPCGWPFVFTVLLHSIIPFSLLAGVGALRRRNRRRRGLCPECRYDLRGLPSGSACPECGPTERDAIAEPVAE